MIDLQWGVLQRTMLQRTVFIKKNQDATTNTHATTNAEEYTYCGMFEYSFH